MSMPWPVNRFCRLVVRFTKTLRTRTLGVVASREFQFGEHYKSACVAHMEEYMKNSRTMIVLAGLVVLVAMMPAAAQNTWNGDQLNVTFKAPMAFYAGDTKMPAGSYHVTQSVDPGTLLVRADKGKHEVILPYDAQPSPAPVKNIEVTFNKYGNDDYLNSIAFGSISSTQGSWVLTIKPSAGEQAAAKAAAATPHKVPATNTPK